MLISNTVGISRVERQTDGSGRMVGDVAFYWKSTPGEGAPRAVFSTSNAMATNIGIADPKVAKAYFIKTRNGMGRKLRDVKQGPQRKRAVKRNTLFTELNTRNGTDSGPSGIQQVTLPQPPFIWPTSGITIVDDSVVSSGVVIIVIGTMAISTSQPEYFSSSVLSFREISSAAFVIRNPYDAPSEWEYNEPHILPIPLRDVGFYMW